MIKKVETIQLYNSFSKQAPNPLGYN